MNAKDQSAQIKEVQKLLNKHKVDAARALLDELALLRPQDPKVLSLLGVSELKKSQYVQAEQYFLQALEKDPRFSEAHFYLATLYLQQEQYEKAIEEYQKVSVFDPAHIQAEINLGLAFENNWRLREAQSIYQRILQEAPQNTTVYQHLARILKKLGKIQESIYCLEKALELAPKDCAILTQLGATFCEINDTQSALACFHKVLAIQPHNAEAIYYLTECQAITANTKQEVKKVHALLRTTLPDRDLMFLHFALGKIADDVNEVDKAFFHFDAANAAWASLKPFYEEAFLKTITQLYQVFDEKFICKKSIAQQANGSPLFIVGMPKSGKSLVEKLLSQFAQVSQCGEQRVLLFLINKAVDPPGSFLMSPAVFKALNQQTMQEMAEYYLNELSHIAPKATWFCDSMPNNFLLLGAIATLFPSAKIIHCTRHPLDLCLMNYSHYAPRRDPFPHDLLTWGRYYQQYAKLMGYWKDIGIENMLEVKYELLVTEPEKVLTSLCEFLEIPVDFKTLHLPILDRREINRWQAYEAQLISLINLLY